MDSNSHYKHQRLQNQSKSGLLRFRSAPSSLLANYTDSGVNNGNSSCERDEPSRLISGFVNFSNSNNTASRSLQKLENKSPRASTEAAMNRMNSQQGLPPHYPRHNSAMSSAMDGSYGLVDPEMQRKCSSSNLLRQSSSPAGLFSNISFQIGYVNSGGNYGRMNGSNGEANSSMNRLKNQISFSSRSSLGMLSEISEVESESMRASNGDPRYNSSGFPYGSWKDASDLSENLSGMKRVRDNYKNLFSDNGEFKMRAKRGFATHPRSIAERERRSRISERMKKLQELVPNMDKQANTADMLDLAVMYIKDLQKQFQALSEKRANCRCINPLNMQQKADANQIVRLASAQPQHSFMR